MEEDKRYVILERPKKVKLGNHIYRLKLEQNTINGLVQLLVLKDNIDYGYNLAFDKYGNPQVGFVIDKDERFHGILSIGLETFMYHLFPHFAELPKKMFPQNAKKISCLFSDLPDELKGKFEENEENKTFYNTPNWVLNTAKTFIKDKDKDFIKAFL